MGGRKGRVFAGSITTAVRQVPCISSVSISLFLLPVRSLICIRDAFPNVSPNFRTWKRRPFRDSFLCRRNKKERFPPPRLRSPAEREKQTDIDSVYVNGGDSCGIGSRIFEKVSIRERLNCHSRDTMRASREPQPPPAQSQYCPKQLTRVSLRRYIRFCIFHFPKSFIFFPSPERKKVKGKSLYQDSLRSSPLFF